MRTRLNHERDFIEAQISTGNIEVRDGQFWRLRKRGQAVPKPYRIDRPGSVGYHRIPIVGGCVYAHRVVWVLNHGPIPDGMEINHKDGNKSNNAIENLELVTHQDNMKHAGGVLKVMSRPPEKFPATVLTREKAREIRRLYAAGGHTHKSLGRQFGVSGVTICMIVNNRVWREPATC